MLGVPPLPSHVSALSRRYAGALVDEDVFQGKELVNSHSLQALVVGLKAYSTWENICCLQDCRECTGGMVSPKACSPCGSPRYNPPWGSTVGQAENMLQSRIEIPTAHDSGFLPDQPRSLVCLPHMMLPGLIENMFVKCLPGPWRHAINIMKLGGAKVVVDSMGKGH